MCIIKLHPVPHTAQCVIYGDDGIAASGGEGLCCKALPPGIAICGTAGSMEVGWEGGLGNVPLWEPCP